MREIQSAEFEKVVLQGGKVAVDFYSTECPPCEALAPKFDNMAELYGDEITFVKMFRQGNKELAQQLGVKSSPTVLFFDNGVQVSPMISGGIKKSDLVKIFDEMLPQQKVDEIKSKITKHITECDVLIIGGGPAGLTAGLYLCQAKINTILVDIQLPGGQVATTHQVSNYPGFIDPQPGYMLSHHMSEQTRLCGTQYKVAVDVANVNLKEKSVEIDAYETIKAKKIIIATGSSPRPLGIAGEKEYKGRGISYCATCDAKYFDDKEVVLIGGGNTAVEEAEFIAKFASKITMIHRSSEFSATKHLQEKIFANPKISVLFDTKPTAFIKDADKMLVEFENLKTKKIDKIISDGIFVFIGMEPNISLFGNDLKTDDWNYLIANEDMETSIPDVYAVGDVRSKKYRQITTAIADGTIAAIAISKELA